MGSPFAWVGKKVPVMNSAGSSSPLAITRAIVVEMMGKETIMVCGLMESGREGSWIHAGLIREATYSQDMGVYRYA